MANIISIDYFIGEIELPNKSDNSTSINQAIVQYEKEILIDLLGYELYALLVADGYESPNTERFQKIVNGGEFDLEYCGKTIKSKWNGLKDETTYQSLLAYYTYYEYVRRSNDHLSGVGNMMLQSETGKRENPSNKLVNSWNRMLDMYGRVPNSCRNIGFYDWNIYYIGNCEVWETPTAIYNALPSLYNFLATNVETYPEWMFTPQGSINIFGI